MHSLASYRIPPGITILVIRLLDICHQAVYTTHSRGIAWPLDGHANNLRYRVYTISR